MLWHLLTFIQRCFLSDHKPRRKNYAMHVLRDHQNFNLQDACESVSHYKWTTGLSGKRCDSQNKMGGFQQMLTTPMPTFGSNESQKQIQGSKPGTCVLFDQSSYEKPSDCLHCLCDKFWSVKINLEHGYQIVDFCIQKSRVGGLEPYINGWGKFCGVIAKFLDVRGF